MQITYFIDRLISTKPLRLKYYEYILKKNLDFWTTKTFQLWRLLTYYFHSPPWFSNLYKILYKKVKKKAFHRYLKSLVHVTPGPSCCSKRRLMRIPEHKYLFERRHWTLNEKKNEGNKGTCFPLYNDEKDDNDNNNDSNSDDNNNSNMNNHKK